MAELASQNAADPDFESPYSREALEVGWEMQPLGVAEQMPAAYLISKRIAKAGR